MSKHSSNGRTWQAIRLSVLERDGFTCYMCGGDATQVDHIIPKAQGGTDELDNLASACWPCNRGKSDSLLSRTPYRSPKWV